MSWCGLDNIRVTFVWFLDSTRCDMGVSAAQRLVRIPCLMSSHGHCRSATDVKPHQYTCSL